jgi:hypothetical protein
MFRVEDLDTQFFFELPTQGLDVGFAIFHLAAGKFPFKRKSGIAIALAHQ